MKYPIATWHARNQFRVLHRQLLHLSTYGDLRHISTDPASGTVWLARQLREKAYRVFGGEPLVCPDDYVRHRPHVQQNVGGWEAVCNCGMYITARESREEIEKYVDRHLAMVYRDYPW